MNPESTTIEHLTPQPTKVELEDVFEGNVLPDQKQIQEIYELEMSSQETPPIRSVEPGEKPNTYLTIRDGQTPEQALADTAVVRREYIRRNTPIPWWYNLPNSLRHYATDPDSIGQPHLAAKHTADIIVDGEKQPGQSFEVFEIGDKTTDEKSLQTIFSTLQLMDQFSGGLLAADPKRPKIVLGNNLDLKKNNGGDELKGYANDVYVFINMDAVAESAQKANANPQEILAVVLTHELLGHGLEKLVSPAGKYFDKHFDYSDERVPGEIFDHVHETVSPKDASVEHSHPVREYGALNVGEDLATSVDSMIGQALGFDRSTSKVETLKSNPDAYRHQLAMQLMDEAAKQALAYENTPGIVGSELRYSRNENGELNVAPARQLEITSLSGINATQAEIAKLLEKSKFPPELIVKAEYDSGI